MKQEVCKNCKQKTDLEDMSEYNGKRLCEGCCQAAFEHDEYDDPHGKDWQ